MLLLFIFQFSQLLWFTATDNCMLQQTWKHFADTHRCNSVEKAKDEEILRQSTLKQLGFFFFIFILSSSSVFHCLRALLFDNLHSYNVLFRRFHASKTNLHSIAKSSDKLQRCTKWTKRAKSTCKEARKESKEIEDKTIHFVGKYLNQKKHRQVKNENKNKLTMCHEFMIEHMRFARHRKQIESQFYENTMTHSPFARFSPRKIIHQHHLRRRSLMESSRVDLSRNTIFKDVNFDNWNHFAFHVFRRSEWVKIVSC